MPKKSQGQKFEKRATFDVFDDLFMISILRLHVGRDVQTSAHQALFIHHHGHARFFHSFYIVLVIE
jgi:hypothetical protein